MMKQRCHARFLRRLSPLLGSVLATGLAVPSASAKAPDPAQARSTHWAFKPVAAPAVPALSPELQKEVQQSLDAIVLSILSEKGLSLAPKADRAVLIKRAYFNLLGVPPAPETVEAFMADPSPDAFAALVDRLLADPRFGERWARYWLDIARYADSKGYVFQEERRYPYSYTYRDWVIRALNRDLSYDRFLVAQLAADRVVAEQAKGVEPLGKAGLEQKDLAAMGFLTLGRRFLNNQADIIDDRIDVTFRGLQGLTVGCARCHDHKFDPIAAADYYSLYGVFQSSVEPTEKPLLGEPERTPEYVAFEKGLKEKETAITNFHEGKRQSVYTAEKIKDQLVAAAVTWKLDEARTKDICRGKSTWTTSTLRWRKVLEKLPDSHPVTGPWRLARRLGADNFESGFQLAFAQAVASPTGVNPLVQAALKQAAPKSMEDVCKVYADLFAKHYLPKAMPEPAAEAVRQVMMMPEGIAGMDLEEVKRSYFRNERDKLSQLQQDLDKYRATAPGGPERAMAMEDAAQPVEPVVFLRGNPGNRGPKVPRQFLSVLNPEAKPFTQGSGRLEMAQRIASKDNPLTARVMVNRVWGWLYGAPLVDTPSDFGVRTEAGVNQALLDHLAHRFMENGWSLKSLIREIMLSRTWQQSAENPLAVAKGYDKIDPENRLHWKAQRRRLDFEAFRDSLLKVSGRLNPKMFGKPMEIDSPEASRRTIYGFIDRQNLPGLFRAFDFASPDQHAPKRFQTTVPQQALFALNNPFVVTQAKALLERPAIKTAATPQEKARQLIRTALSRQPSEDEVTAAATFAEGAPVGQAACSWEFGHGAWDESTKQLSFSPFTYFGQGRWSGSDTLPDAKVGWATLSATHGHPGDPAHAAILRWKPIESATVTVSGTINRKAKAGDGIRVRLISEKHGLIQSWDVPPQSAVNIQAEGIALEAGEALSWVIDCRENENSDSFEFSPRLTDQTTGASLATLKDEFAGPAQDSWTSLAQTLLVSNEFMFVD